MRARVPFVTMVMQVISFGCCDKDLGIELSLILGCPNYLFSILYGIIG
jgi:hypothetical protein